MHASDPPSASPSPPPVARPVRHVACDLAFAVDGHATLALQIAAAGGAGPLLAERLDVTVDGSPLPRQVTEVAAPHGGRIHLVHAPAGALRISSAAADTAFATTLRGGAELTSAEIRAVVDGDLPLDDHRAPVGIA